MDVFLPLEYWLGPAVHDAASLAAVLGPRLRPHPSLDELGDLIVDFDKPCGYGGGYCVVA